MKFVSKIFYIFVYYNKKLMNLGFAITFLVIIVILLIITSILLTKKTTKEKYENDKTNYDIFFVKKPNCEICDRIEIGFDANIEASSDEIAQKKINVEKYSTPESAPEKVKQKLKSEYPNLFLYKKGVLIKQTSGRNAGTEFKKFLDESDVLVDDEE